MSPAQQPITSERPVLGSAYTLETPRLASLTPLQRQVRDRILSADHAGDYEAVDCLCGASAAILLSQVERHGLPYRKVVCSSCGLLRASPRWTAGRYSRFYEHEYRDLYNPIVDSKEQLARKLNASPWFRELANWVVQGYRSFGNAKARPRVIEIGAGGGWNLGGLPADWDRIGYDVDREYLEIGERVFGCTMRQGFVTDALTDLGSADIVLLSHVVEHFSNPIDELSKVAAAMSGTALLFIEVPGIFRLHKTNLDVMSYMQNAHTFTFCASTLDDVCHRAGLEVLQIDETVRVVCRRVPNGMPARARPAPNPKLVAGIVAYLQRCETGYRVMRAIKRVPVAGRYLAALWRYLYFPMFGITAGSMSKRS
jgi:hypothetical protein